MSDTNITNTLVHDAILVLLDEMTGTSRKAAAKQIHEALAGHHRTVQQAFWSAILLAQIEYATEPFDERNKASVILANQVKDLAKKLNYDQGLPRI